MEHEAAQHGINWTQVLLAIIGQVGVIIILWMKQRSDRQSLERTIAEAKKSVNSKIDTAQESVNENVGKVHGAVIENTDITTEGQRSFIHELKNGLGTELAKKTAAELQPALVKAADKVAEAAKVNMEKTSEAAKDAADKVAQVAAEKGDDLKQIATDVIVAERASGQAKKRFDEGVAEGRRLERMEAEARQAAKTDLEIPIPKQKDKG